MGSPNAMDAGVYRLGEARLQEGCSGIECAVADALSSQLLLFVTITLLALVALTFLHRARDECSEEQSRVETELAAFERFERRVRGLSPATAQPSTAGQGGAMLAQANAADRGSQLQEVRRAYEDTVMSVPHFDEDYGESLEEHMTAEFGGEVAAAVVDGPALTPQVKQALVHKSAESRQERTAFLETLTTERESLETAAQELGRIDERVERIGDRRRLQQSFRELADHWEELDALEADCEDHLERRQEQVRRGSAAATWRDDGHSLCAYLYEPLPVTYPVLADGTLLLDRIKTTKRRVTDALTRRV